MIWEMGHAIVYYTIFLFDIFFHFVLDMFYT